MEEGEGRGREEGEACSGHTWPRRQSPQWCRQAVNDGLISEACGVELKHKRRGWGERVFGAYLAAPAIPSREHPLHVGLELPVVRLEVAAGVRLQAQLLSHRLNAPHQDSTQLYEKGCTAGEKGRTAVLLYGIPQ